MLLVFSGTDGAGKSTHIRLLRKYLEGENKRVVELWSRGGYTPGFVFLKRLARTVLVGKLPDSGESKHRNNIMENPRVSTLWLNVAILDLIVFYGVYVRLLSILGFVVICDRYIEDTLLDFKRNFGKRFNINGCLWRILLLLSPTPKKSFLLTVPVTVSVARSKLKNEPFPDSVETLTWRLEKYNDINIFPLSVFHSVECEKTIDHISQHIIGEVSSLI